MTDDGVAGTAEEPTVFADGERLSLGVAARLSRYLQVLTQARKMGKDTISSQELSDYTHINSTQIRRDLSGFGKFGKRGVGYNVDSLVSQIRRIAVIGEVNYVAVAPFHNGGPVGTAAALHLAASLPNFFIQQIPLPEAAADREMRKAIGGDIEAVKAGFAALPTGPGLGITVNESALERYQEAA